MITLEEEDKDNLMIKKIDGPYTFITMISRATFGKGVDIITDKDPITGEKEENRVYIGPDEIPYLIDALWRLSYTNKIPPITRPLERAQWLKKQ